LFNLQGHFRAQLYHTDLLTRDTIIKTASPKLLKELKVKYILINDFSSLDPKTQENLLNNLKLVKNYSNRRFLFEAEEQGTEELEQDYSWILTSYQGNKMIVVKGPGGSTLSFATKKEALNYLKDIKSKDDKLRTDLNFVWLGAQAAPKAN
jgi:hypothetical protein